MKYTVRILIFLTALLSISPLHGYKKRAPIKIRVGIFQLAPLNFTDEKGVDRGLYPDLIRKIADEKQWEVIFVPGTWAEGLKRLHREEIDILTAIASTPERKKTLDFNNESVFDLWGQVFLPLGNPLHSIMDLKGRRVAVMEEDISGKNFIKTAKKLGITCEIVPLPTHTHIFHAIQEGRVAAGVVPQYFGMRHAQNFNLVASSIQFCPFSVYFAAKKGRQADILKTIDTYLYQWKQDKDSYYHNRLSYWIAPEEYKEESIPPWLWITVAAIAAILVLLAYINRTLNITVKKRTQELHSREKQYRDLVESANSIILRMDQYGHILFLNQFGLNLFGYTKEEIYGRNVIGTILSPDEARAQKLCMAHKKILELPEKYELFENKNICKDGHTIYIQWSNKATIDDRGQFQEILSIGTDITQRKQLEASLYQAQKMEAMGTLAGGIAHDFNNILSVIFGYTELARLSIDDPKKVEEALEQITQGGKRAKNLVSQILTFSTQSNSEKHPVQLSLIIEETITLLAPSLPPAITLTQDLASQKMIQADPTQIHQIIMNLCTNACHAMETTGGTLHISLKDISLRGTPFDSKALPLPPGEYIQLEVQDNGTGITPGVIQKIFDPYFTTKGAGKGTGLGLSIVHGIVQAHRGHIQAWSLPETGTTFQVTLHASQEHDLA